MRHITSKLVDLLRFRPNKAEVLRIKIKNWRSNSVSAPPIVRDDIFHNIRCGVKADQRMIEAE